MSEDWYNLGAMRGARTSLRMMLLGRLYTDE